MVYKAGDNNLSENMAFSLDEIASTVGQIQRSTRGDHESDGEAIDTTDINVLVYFDGNSLTAPTRYIDYSEAEPVIEDKISDFQHYRKEGSVETKLPEVKDTGNRTDSSSAYSILNFIRWCLNERKKTAKNYAIVFSGHSFGFHGTSFLRDESHGGYTTLWSFRWALQTAVNDILNKQKFAILGFDSCVMSMLEIGCELKDVATTMIASEGSLPNSGWSYSAVLSQFLPVAKSTLTDEITKAAQEDFSALNKLLKSYGFDDKGATKMLEPFSTPAGIKSNGANIDINIDPNSLKGFVDEIASRPEFIRQTAKDFVTHLIERHNRLLIGGRSIDVAAWDLGQVEDVVKKFNELAKVLNQGLAMKTKIEEEGLKDNDIAIFWELKKVLLQAHYDSQTYMNEQCVDLKDFCKRLIIESKFVTKYDDLKPAFEEIIKHCKAVIESVDKCVIHSGFSGDEYQFSNGISVFFPWSRLSLALTNYRYRYLIFSQGAIRPVGSRTRNLNEMSEYEGPGKDWYFFLVNYLNNVTLRQTRSAKILKTAEDGRQEPELDSKGKAQWQKALIEDFTKSNPIWSKSNPIWSKSNPIWSKSNPDASKSMPSWGRSNPDASRSNPDASRSNPVWSKGEVGNYLFYFSRFKNFENCWDVNGYASDFGFESEFEDQEPAAITGDEGARAR